MDVVVRAWRWGVTFATAKKLQSLAAGTAAILVRRIAEARNGPRQILNNEKVFTSFKAIWSPDPPFVLASCASYRQWGMGWLTYLNEPLA